MVVFPIRKTSAQILAQNGKKTKTGSYATGAEILEDLAASGSDIAAKVLDWRQIAKLKST